jgi:hypothetical protein
MLRGNLIDRRAEVYVRPGRLLRPATGEQRGVGPRMVAGAVGARGCVDVIQPADHLDLALERRQRLHRGAQLELRTVARRPPVRLVHAIRNRHERHPNRRPGNRGTRFGSARNARQQRGKSRQRHARAHAAQKLPSAQRPLPLRRQVSRRLIAVSHDFILYRLIVAGLSEAGLPRHVPCM